MTYAGISHLTFNRQEFVAQVPKWLQFSPAFRAHYKKIKRYPLGARLAENLRCRQTDGRKDGINRIFLKNFLYIIAIWRIFRIFAP